MSLYSANHMLLIHFHGFTLIFHSCQTDNDKIYFIYFQFTI